ncbi:glycosyltransferase family 2 protein [Candidatus Saccharibacteria bacterium]|nr:glycosyltransferase family 2 protein [Candidatus Saccharibacteria bacterium]
MKKVSSTEKASAKKIRKTRAKKPVFDGPLVSIVMPAHNAADFIDDAIHSVLGQSYGNWELIVVDDASSDKTLEVVKQFGDERIRVIKCLRNGGAAKARNRGVGASKGKFLCFLDADDLWQPDKLERQLAFMAKKDCAFSFASYVFADSKGRPNGKVVRVPETITYRQVLRSGVVLASTVMFDMSRFSKKDMEIADVKDGSVWKKVFDRVESAYGMHSVMAIKGYEAGISFWQKMRRGVR